MNKADQNYIDNSPRYRDLMEQAKKLPPVITAVAHPCDDVSLTGALEAMEAGLIQPILVGPVSKIRQVAREHKLDISRFKTVDLAFHQRSNDADSYEIPPFSIIPTEHSHQSAEIAVSLVKRGFAHSLMKGSLHSDELLSAVLDKTHGLRTARRLSHVFVMDVPTYHKQLLITDGAVNILPDLTTKADIVQNAIELAQALGISTPKVAILCAVETVNPTMPATLDAAALCKMAERGQIKGGILDGPLAFDNAISADAAAQKGIKSVVSGEADILVAPELEAGNILAKQLTWLSNAHSAGIVLGARVPIMLTSRSDSAVSRLASAAVAQLMANFLRK
ncbi:bifunctional enoyl-CoA hydratase/phosphate acetyltransferase [Leeia sp. TBRC 13508]|uniref:Bifunctional enoyl-CoA hydratase/phosphate acetyltransferase n=1 Tax=Leeia speluncae TaxID=2884804 RepID=A0ABS8D869_9NEIS|nr:bifunctional enoyl-CoA hydratase/phosphate acetyltransferase [Leeia speluncae]MCB6184387.1 bifunctional enoyl-CoA hydratase/phosphate acetyltransferase [Leeia speluncae]